MDGKLTFSGGPELEAALKELGGKIASRLGENAVRAGSRVIVAQAKLRVPVRTGELRNSIRVARTLDRTTGSRTAYAGTRLFYANFVEFGTAHSSPKPFLRPAADEAGQAAVDKLAENLGNGINRETAKHRGK